MVRVIREFLKIPETVFTTQVISQHFKKKLFFDNNFCVFKKRTFLIIIFVLFLQEILDICGVLNVNAHELPVTPTPTQVQWKLTTKWKFTYQGEDKMKVYIPSWRQNESLHTKLTTKWKFTYQIDDKMKVYIPSWQQIESLHTKLMTEQVMTDDKIG